MGFKVISVEGKVTSNVKTIGGMVIDVMTITEAGALHDPEPGDAPDFMVMTSKVGRGGVTEIAANHCVFPSIDARAAAYEVILKAMAANVEREAIEEYEQGKRGVDAP